METALEKFIEQLKQYDIAKVTDDENWIIKIPAWVLTEKIEQAEKEEKQQIISAWENGYENGACVNDETIYHGSRYFQKTFKENKDESN